MGKDTLVDTALGFTLSLVSPATVTPDHQRVLFRAKKIFDELVYDTAALENSPYTFPEVQTLLDNVTVGGHKLEDQNLVLNQAESWRQLFRLVKNNQFSLDKDTYCKLHSTVEKEEALSRGEFRKGAVSIAGTTHRPPNHEQLDKIFTSGLKNLRTIKDPYLRSITFFLFGALNQFFYDGNKRTSRLMMNGILLQAGQDIISVSASKKLEFNKAMIAFYDSKNGENATKFLLGCKIL